jgi:hypothetical protein
MLQGHPGVDPGAHQEHVPGKQGGKQVEPAVDGPFVFTL